MSRRRWMVIAAVAVVASVTIATFPRWKPGPVAPWAVTAGEPYPIALDSDGCPIVIDRPFVDAPGPLVPPDPTEVTLCVTPAGALPAGVTPDEPPQRTLRAGAAEFAAVLNAMPDRNEAWRRLRGRHSGWWPDPPPAPMGETCAYIAYTFDRSFVFHYPDGSSVAVVSACARSTVTTGTRTRMDLDKPHVYDEFLRRFDAQ